MPDSTHPAGRSTRVRFAMVPQWVYRRVDDLVALRFYIHLSGTLGDCATLAEDLGYPEHVVTHALGILRQAGAIRPSSRGGYAMPMDEPPVRPV